MASVQQSSAATAEAPSDGATAPDGSGNDAWQGLGRDGIGMKGQVMLSSIHGQALLGVAMFGLVVAPGGRALGSDQGRRVGVGTTGVTLGPVEQETSSDHHRMIASYQRVQMIKNQKGLMSRTLATATSAAARPGRMCPRPARITCRSLAGTRP